MSQIYRSEMHRIEVSGGHRQALESSKPAEAKKLLPETASLVDVMVKKGIIHQNTGNRYKSRLARRVASG